MRQCLGCKGVFPRHELLRLVKRPDGAICFDASRRAQGRGGYVCPDISCLRKASKSRHPRFNLSLTEIRTLVEEMRKHYTGGIARAVVRAARMGYLSESGAADRSDLGRVAHALCEHARHGAEPNGYACPAPIKEGYPFLPALARDLKLLERLSSEVF
ncbi:MAG: YlxR family protein [Syntrophaceae bacterium]